MRLTLVTMTQGNPLALLNTINSASLLCDEFIVGSVCVFPEDVDALLSIAKTGNIKIIPLPFNFIYENGFAKTLNILSDAATNEWCIYLNVGEIIESSIHDNPLSHLTGDYNCFYIDHAKENHRWYRGWKPSEMTWSGVIHEEITGDHRPFYKPLFRFADTEKDQDSPFRAAVYNDVKEVVYWHNLMRIAKEPEKYLGATSSGWIQFALENYDVMVKRLALKGKRPEAFETGNLEMYLTDIYNTPEFQKERFQSNHIIEFQGDPLYLNKK